MKKYVKIEQKGVDTIDNFAVKSHYLSSMTPQEQGYALLDRAVLNMTGAREAFSQNRFEEANRLLLATENIFAELGGALRADDEASRHGAALFELFQEELFFVNLNKDLKRLDEIKELTLQLKIIYGTQLGKLRFT